MKTYSEWLDIQPTETTWSPDNSNALLKSKRCIRILYAWSASALAPQQAQVSIRMGQIPQWNKYVHAQGTPGNTIPCLAKHAGKVSIRTLRTRVLRSSDIQWKPDLIWKPPSKSQPLKAGQSRHPATSPSLHSMLHLEKVAKMHS